MVAPVSASTQPGVPVDRLRQQAEELEGVFLHTLVKQMFSEIQTDGAFGGGFGEETWRSMQAEQMAQSMAAAGGIGLADQILKDLLALQEVVPATAPATAANAYNGAKR